MIAQVAINAQNNEWRSFVTEVKKKSSIGRFIARISVVSAFQIESNM